MLCARRIASRWRAHGVVAAICLTFEAMTARDACAQSRVHFEEIGDEAFHALLLPRGDDETHDPFRANAYAGIAGSSWRGADGANVAAPFLGIGIAAWSSPATFAHARTDLLLPMRDDRTSLAPTWRDIEGSHRARAQLGLGALDEGATGVDVEIEGALLQAASTTTSFLRRDLPARAFRDGTARATLWPRFMDSGHEGILTPVSYAIRRVDYDGVDGITTGGFTSERIASGFGFRDYGGEMVHGWVELMGLSWERARFDVAPGVQRPQLGSVERIDVSFLRLDALTGAASSDLHYSATTNIGATWLWDPTTHREVSTFTFELAGSLRQILNRSKPDETMGAGLALARRAGYMADGSALTQGWRVEMFADATAFHGRAGGSIRGAVEQLSLPNAPNGGFDAGFRSVFATEWFIGLTPALHLGAFHVSTDRCPAVVSPIAEWCHQLGVFARVRAETAAAPPPPKPTKPNDDARILDDPEPPAPPDLSAR